MGIRREDVDLGRREILVRQMKYRREHRVCLSANVAGLIESWSADRTSGWLFPGQRGDPLTARHVARRLAGWCVRAGVEVIAPHVLRHTFASGLYARTGDLLLVSEALGHASLASTFAYARVNGSRLRLAVAD